MPSLQVMIVSEHPLVRERLRQLLPSRDVAAASLCGGGMRAAQEEVIRTKPGLLMLDLHQNVPQGLQLIGDIQRLVPETRILTIISVDDPLYIERVLAAGARGCVHSSDGAAAIKRAIRRVIAGRDRVGGKPVAPSRHRARGRGRGAAARAAARPITRLTDRELQVLELLGQGHRTGRVAAELSLSRKTVETYYARLKQKLELANGDQLVRTAIRWAHGAVEPGRNPSG